jgi:hypothetical protein
MAGIGGVECDRERWCDVLQGRMVWCWVGSAGRVGMLRWGTKEKTRKERRGEEVGYKGMERRWSRAVWSEVWAMDGWMEKKAQTIRRRKERW